MEFQSFSAMSENACSWVVTCLALDCLGTWSLWRWGRKHEPVKQNMKYLFTILREALILKSEIFRAVAAIGVYSLIPSSQCWCQMVYQNSWMAYVFSWLGFNFTKSCFILYILYFPLELAFSYFFHKESVQKPLHCLRGRRV